MKKQLISCTSKANSMMGMLKIKAQLVKTLYMVFIRPLIMNSIFIDESAVQPTKNAHRIWNKPVPNETRLGLVLKYSHLESVCVLGGISRKGPTPLMIYKGLIYSKLVELCLYA